MLTERKLADQYRHDGALKRGGGNDEAVPEPGLNSAALQDFSDKDPGPEFVAAFNDSLARGITRLDGNATREVALLRMEGYEVKEIASQLGISVSSVERKLRVSREVWQEEFGK